MMLLTTGCRQAEGLEKDSNFIYLASMLPAEINFFMKQKQTTIKNTNILTFSTSLAESYSYGVLVGLKYCFWNCKNSITETHRQTESH